MLQSKIVSCRATADAGQQSQMLSRKRPMLDTFMGFVKKFARIPQNCLRNMYFFTPLVSLIDRGAFSKNAKDIATWSTTIVPRT